MAEVSALDVAAAILEERPGLDQMQLHKLLYLVQAADLVWYDTPAFSEHIEAWRHGPVVRVVAGHYKDFGQSPIERPVSGDPSELSDRLRSVIREIVAKYGARSGFDLAAECKRPGSPWREARGAIGDHENSSAEITPAAIATWHRAHGVVYAEPTDVENALAQRFLDGDDAALEQLFSNAFGAAQLR